MANKTKFERTLVPCFSGDRDRMIENLKALRSRVSNLLRDYGHVLGPIARTEYNKILKDVEFRLTELRHVSE